MACRQEVLKPESRISKISALRMSDDLCEGQEQAATTTESRISKISALRMSDGLCEAVEPSVTNENVTTQVLA